MPAFNAAIRHWPTLDAFVAYLRTVPRPPWCHGVTNHNTYIPNETQWRGIASVESCRDVYIGKGWSAGPHLFLAASAPDPANIGIFQLTPITDPGVHAGACNSDHLGIENVGDFDAHPPTPAQLDLLYGVNRAILRAWGLPPSAVNVHNECMPGRTCPGRYLTGAQVRQALSVPPKPSLPAVYRFRYSQVVYQSRDVMAPVALGPTNGATVFVAGDTVLIGDITSGWGWVATGIGFVPMTVLEKA